MLKISGHHVCKYLQMFQIEGSYQQFALFTTMYIICEPRTLSFT